METQKFHHAKYIVFKNCQKETKILQDIITLTNFNTSQNIIFKNPHIKIDLLPIGQNPLSYYIL
jgi:hypothetical protein